MLKLNFDFEKIFRNTGIKFVQNSDIILYLQDLASWLCDNNKNYTQKQYYKICDLKEILYAVDNCEQLKGGE